MSTFTEQSEKEVKETEKQNSNKWYSRSKLGAEGAVRTWGGATRDIENSP